MKTQEVELELVMMTDLETLRVNSPVLLRNKSLKKWHNNNVPLCKTLENKDSHCIRRLVVLMENICVEGGGHFVTVFVLKMMKNLNRLVSSVPIQKGMMANIQIAIRSAMLFKI